MVDATGMEWIGENIWLLQPCGAMREHEPWKFMREEGARRASFLAFNPHCWQVAPWSLGRICWPVCTWREGIISGRLTTTYDQ